jgi:hypothetical protein
MLATAMNMPFGLQLICPEEGGLLYPVNLGISDRSGCGEKKLAVSLPSATSPRRSY